MENVASISHPQGSGEEFSRLKTRELEFLSLFSVKSALCTMLLLSLKALNFWFLAGMQCRGPPALGQFSSEGWVLAVGRASVSREWCTKMLGRDLRRFRWGAILLHCTIHGVKTLGILLSHYQHRIHRQVANIHLRLNSIVRPNQLLPFNLIACKISGHWEQCRLRFSLQDSVTFLCKGIDSVRVTDVCSFLLVFSVL